MTMHPDKVRGDSGLLEPEAELAAQIEPFDSFWEGPEDVESGYATFYEFYRRNYLKHLPPDRDGRILVISCGPGYFVNLLAKEGYRRVVGIDSFGDKAAHGRRHGLDCREERAFPFLAAHKQAFEVIICEQELNHLTKEEMIRFLGLVRQSLTPAGTLIVHALNGANPITGAEALAQNFDHQNTFTEYSLRQVLEHTGFERTQVFPLHLYVFYKNPANYVAWGASAALSALFRICFVLYGKSNRLFTKKIGASCRSPG
jgi:2-polyprenyl-3-methyl-5-hydroxy-6-metoxy-1,4-benzoquinol methylase